MGLEEKLPSVKETLSQNLVTIAGLIKEANGLSQVIKGKVLGNNDCESSGPIPDEHTMMSASVENIADLERLIRTLNSINCSL